jgi:hypothetical protein
MFTARQSVGDEEVHFLDNTAFKWNYALWDGRTDLMGAICTSLLTESALAQGKSSL